MHSFSIILLIKTAGLHFAIYHFLISIYTSCFGYESHIPLSQTTIIGPF